MYRNGYFWSALDYGYRSMAIIHVISRYLFIFIEAIMSVCHMLTLLTVRVYFLENMKNIYFGNVFSVITKDCVGTGI